MLTIVLAQALSSEAATTWMYVIVGVGTLASLLGLVGLGVWLFRKIHQWANTPVTLNAQQSLLTQMRDAHERGEIEDEEYRNIRDHLAQTLYHIYLKDEPHK